MQNHYSLLYREEEREMFPTLKVSPVAHSHPRGCFNRILPQMFGVGSMPWSPLGRGLLTRTSREATVRGNTDKFSTTFDMPFLGELTSRYVEYTYTSISGHYCAPKERCLQPHL